MYVVADRPGPRVMFVHRWGAVMAGGEVWIRTLLRHLQRQSVTTITALHIRGPLYSALTEMGVTVRHSELSYLRGSPRTALLSSGLSLVRSAVRLSKLVVDTKTQLVHAFSPESTEVALLASRLARVPLISTVMNCGPYPAFDRYVLRRSDRAIAISRAVEADLLELGASPERVLRIPLGISFDAVPDRRTGDLRRELGIPDDVPLIGVVATLEPKKAQDVLLRAIPLVVRSFPSAEFALIGTDHATTATSPGPYESRLRQLARSLEVTDRVHFLGFRPNAAALVADFDVSVLCSRKEALGLAAVEALAVGVPLVATAVEGLVDVVDDGVTGLLVPPDDPEALASRITTLLADRALAARLASEGRRVVRERFDAAGLAARNREVYESLLAAKR